MKRRLIIFIFFCFTLSGYSQELVTFSNQRLGRELCEVFGRSFTSETEANDAINKILSTIGASKRFVVQSCNNIPNAAAITIRGIRYIYYNKQFMSQINSYTNYWSNMSILAHEIGHHINGHTTDALLIINDVVDVESLSESRRMELEADEFAGFVLAKLGATLTQATEAIALISSNEDDTYSTHPSKSKRLAAIRKGYNNGKSESISIYNKTLKNKAEEYAYSGYEKQKNEDYDGAISDYTIAIELNPNYRFAYSERGYNKIKLKDYSGAIKDYTKAIELDPNDAATSYYNRGYIKNKLRDYESAIVDLRKSIELEPPSDAVYRELSYAYNWAGHYKAELKDYSGAIAYLNKAVEFKLLHQNLDPYYSDPYFTRGLLRVKLKDYLGAIEDYTMAIAIQKEKGWSNEFRYYYYNRGKANFLLKEYYGAIADYNKAFEMGYNSYWIYKDRGDAKKNLGDLDGACTDWRKAANLGDANSKKWVANQCN